MSFLEKAVSGKIRRPRKILIYGAHAVGKTTWAARFPKAIIVSIEDGTSDIDCTRIPSSEFKKAEDVLQAVIEIAKSDDFETVVIDSADWLERMIETGLMDSGFSFDYGRGAAEIARRFSKFLKVLDKCVESGKTVILVAHQEVREAKDTQGKSWDQIQPKLSKRVTELVLEYVDEGLLAMREDFVRTEKGKFGAETAIASTSGRRVLKTDSHPAYLACSRLELPSTMSMNDPITPFLNRESDDE